MKIVINKETIYRVSKDGQEIFNSSSEFEAALTAINAKLESLGSRVEYSTGNLITIQNAVNQAELFKNTFWRKKRNTDLVPNSTELVNSLVEQTKWGGKTWINTYEYSTPIYYVNSSFKKVPVSIVQNGQEILGFPFHDELKNGVPIPDDPIVAAGTDGHMTIIDVDSRKLYEFWQFKNVNGQWQSSWGGIINDFDNKGAMEWINGWRPGATATGLPVCGGTILLSELASGVISHALAFAMPKPKNTFVSPAINSDGAVDGVIPEGSCFKLPADIEISDSLSPIMKMIITAVRDYGMYLRDVSGSVNFFGEDPRQYELKDDPYKQYFGGLELWDVMLQFPWDKLQAVDFNG